MGERVRDSGVRGVREVREVRGGQLTYPDLSGFGRR